MQMEMDVQVNLVNTTCRTTATTTMISAAAAAATAKTTTTSKLIDNIENYGAELSLDTTLLAVYNGIIFVCILFGNTLTIIAVRTCRRLRATISNLFIASLAISDFIVGLTVPYHMAFYVGPDLDQYRYICVLRFVLIIFACSVSTFTLISIAIDRYIAIVYPLQYRRYATRRVAYFKIAFNWLCGAIVAGIPLIWNNWFTATHCEFDEILPIWYMAGVLTPGYLIIWLLMSLLYWRILRVASRQAQQLRNSICSTNKSSAMHSDWKSVQVVVLIMGSFSICWLPYFIVALGKMFCLFNITSALYKGALSLAMTNSCINPVIYAWKNSNFRRAFIKLLRCKSPNGCPRELMVSQYSIRSHTLTRRRHSIVQVEGFAQHENGSNIFETTNISSISTPKTLRRSKSAMDISNIITEDLHTNNNNNNNNNNVTLSDDDSSSINAPACGSCVKRKSTTMRKCNTIHKAIEAEMSKYQRAILHHEMLSLPTAVFTREFTKNTNNTKNTNKTKSTTGPS